METEYPRQVEGQFEIRKIIYTYGNYYDNTIARGPVDLDLERFSIKRTSEFPHNGEFNRTDVGFRFSEISGLQLDKNASNWEIRFDYNSKVNNLKLVERGKYFLTIQKSKRGQKNIRQNQKIENLYTELIRAIEFKKKLARRDGTQRDYAEVESWKEIIKKKEQKENE